MHETGCTIAAEPRMVEQLGTWSDHTSSEVRAKVLVFTNDASGSEVKERGFVGLKVTIGITPMQ